MSGEALLRAYIDRILRLKEEQDTIGDDIKEVYAEAKGNGYDKTAMGSLVSELRKKGRDASKFEEASSLLDLYRDAYERASHTPAPARTREIITQFHPASQASAAADGQQGIPSDPDDGAKSEGVVSALAGGVGAEPKTAYVEGSQAVTIPPSSSPSSSQAETTATDAPPPASVATNSKANCLNPDTCKLHFTSALCWQCNDARQKARAA